MSSVLRSVSRRKKGRTLGPVEIIRREDYADLELDAKVELIRSLVPLGLMHVEELLDAEVTALAGGHYARKDASVGGRRHGSNPGTVGLAGQRVPIRVPRIRHVAGSEIPLRSYEALHGDRAVNDVLLKRVLSGISCRNYEAAAEAIPGAIGLSGSTVSRGFIQASAAKLRELQERDLSGEDVGAVVLDGKTFAEATMVIALGITIAGGKRFLGFVETDTENARVLTPFLRSLVERGLDLSQGVLVILDGSKGLRAGKKLHLGVDQAGVIVAQALTDSAGDDASTGIDLIATIASSARTVTADAAYDTLAFYETANTRGTTVVVPPAKTATLSRRNPRSSARDGTIRRISKIGRRRWKKEVGYHRQARVENAFFRYTSILGDRLRRRTRAAQAVESVRACNVLNRMTELGRPESFAIDR